MNDYNINDIIDNLQKINIKFEKSNILDSEYLGDQIIYKNLDIYKHNIICLGIPNVFCKQHFDDEDFIYSKLELPKYTKNQITNNQTNTHTHNNPSIYENITDIIIKSRLNIDFTKIPDDIQIANKELYYKCLYIYQYVHSYYNLAENNYTISECIATLPSDFTTYISNIITIILKFINLKDFTDDMSVLMQELLYGLNLIICHLKININHLHGQNLNIYALSDAKSELFMRCLNNLCCIIFHFNTNDLE